MPKATLELLSRAHVNTRRCRHTSVLGAEVLLAACGVCFHGLAAGLPTSGTHFPMLVDKLECLDQAESFVNVTPHWKVVDGDLSQILLDVDDEESSEGEPLVILQHTVGPGDFHGLISQEGNVHLAQATLLPSSVDPSQM